MNYNIRKNQGFKLKFQVTMDFSDASQIDLFHGDCMEYINTLEENSVDCIITDPPYFLDTMDDDWSHDAKIGEIKTRSHINGLCVGMKFDVKQGQNLKKFIHAVSLKLIQKLKPGGFFVCFSSSRMYHNLVSGIEDAGFQIRDQIIWNFGTSQVKAFRQDHIIDRDKHMTEDEKSTLKESLKHFRTPQLKSQFEPICIATKPIENRYIDNMIKWGTGLMHINEDGKVSQNLLYFPKPSKKEKGDFNTHPTVKPVELIKYLIDIYCPENGTILDPFTGSGTTAVAAVAKNRKFKGSEKNKEYIDIIKKRIT